MVYGAVSWEVRRAFARPKGVGGELTRFKGAAARKADRLATKRLILAGIGRGAGNWWWHGLGVGFPKPIDGWRRRERWDERGKGTGC